MKVLPMHFYTMPEQASMAMEKEDLKELLLTLSGWITACGKIYDIKSEHLGVNVYKVYLERRHK